MNPLLLFWASPVWLHRAAGLLVLAGLGLLLAAGLLWMAQREAFSLKVVEVQAPATSLLHVQDADVREALERGLAGSVLATPMAPIRDALNDHPWIRDVTLRRVWPNRFLIQIQEHEPVAAWRDGRLLNRQGELFVADQAWSQAEAETLYGCHLVELAGPEGTHPRVLARAAQAQRLVELYGLGLQSLALSDQYAWQAQLNDGTELALGQDELPTPWEARLSAFGKVLQRVSSERQSQAGAAPFSRVDLRYANGFAFLPARASQAAPVARSPLPNCLHRLLQGQQHAA